MPRLHFTPGKDPVPILQEAGRAPGPVWTGGKFRPHRYSILDIKVHVLKYKICYSIFKYYLIIPEDDTEMSKHVGMNII